MQINDIVTKVVDLPNHFTRFQCTWTELLFIPVQAQDGLAVNGHFLAWANGNHLDHNFLFNDRVNDTDLLFVDV